MNPHFSQPLFTLPSFGSGFKVQGSGFRVQGSGFRVQGSGFRVQGSGFRIEVAASPPFLEDGILVSQPSPLGNAIKLSGRTFLAPHRGSSPKG